MRSFTASLVAVFAALFPQGHIYAESSAGRPLSEPMTEAIINPIPLSDNSIASGKRIYAQSCVTCHGEDGKGEPGMVGMLEVDPPDLTDSAWTHGDSDGAVFGIIRDGTKTGMEPMSAKLNERQIWNLVNYLRSIASDVVRDVVVSDEPEAKQPTTTWKESVSLGKQYYVRMCVECHGMDGRGHTEMVEFLFERPANLRKDTWKYGTKASGVFRIIREGTPNDMPGFSEKLTEDQTWHIVNYLKSIRGKD